ncbi:UDP-N-acetylmuramoyl-L-alanyl-D-glutamate--2,6-diaminopimelate ligase [bacterium]|nr:UDP-N-acetylmuramoyl-L-alanyl-D-glutamate--2,6-diaminopimelate ligase [bacterium]
MKKTLKHITEGIELLNAPSNLDVEVDFITLDSREVKPGCLFAALRGTAVDGHEFIEKAISAGASAILCEDLPENTADIPCIQVADSAHALGLISSAFYDHPSKKLKLVGITGTNGKTSTATMLYELYRLLGKKAGLLSTIKYSINGTDYTSTHTTPHAIRINELLAEMVDADCEYAFMEVSSHALAQERVAGIEFAGAIFTNITHDHLDYHKDFRDYLYTKKKLFDGLNSDAFALYNRDDKNGQVMVQNCKATKYSYSLKSMSDFKTRIIESDFEGMLIDLRGAEVWMKLVGEFNAYNVLAVYSAAFLLGAEHEDLITAMSMLRSVDGRFQHIVHGGITAVVDYAHTPDALQNVLDTINAVRTGNEELIVVLGCGGNRDKEKRPIMARIATRHATRLIITSDNPRNEDPAQIMEDMQAGVEPQNYKKVLKIQDREEAIKTAIGLSKPGDVILVAGKGHETYQEINGVRHPFDDKEVLERNLKLLHN